MTFDRARQTAQAHAVSPAEIDPGAGRGARASAPAGASSAASGLEAVVCGPERERRPVLVAVHGIGRRHQAQAKAWRAFAERRGLLLVAPHFEADRYDDFQRLGRAGRGERADLALIDLLDRLAEEGCAGDDLYLVGYSGGGQFAHRFALAWPARVRAVVTVAAGWYTFPDRARPFPYGMRASAQLPGVRFDLASALAVPSLVLVGDRDDERDPALRVSARVLRQQGPHRVARARAWVDAMNRAAAERGRGACARFELLPGAGHSFGECVSAGLAGRVDAFLDEVSAERGAGR